MISLGESLIVLAVTIGLVGLAVFKSRRFRFAVGVMMVITAVRVLIGVVFG